MSPRIICLKDRTNFRNPAEFWPPRLFAFELRRCGDAAMPGVERMRRRSRRSRWRQSSALTNAPESVSPETSLSAALCACNCATHSQSPFFFSASFTRHRENPLHSRHSRGARLHRKNATPICVLSFMYSAFPILRCLPARDGDHRVVGSTIDSCYFRTNSLPRGCERIVWVRRVAQPKAGKLLRLFAS